MYKTPSTQPSSHFIFIAMAAFLSFLLVSLLLFFTISATSPRHHSDSVSPSDYNNNNSIINETCKASRDPTACRASLSQSSHMPPSPSPLQVIQSALSLSSTNLINGRTMVQQILNEASATNQNRSMGAKACLQVLRYSEYRMNSAAEALPRGKLKDARAWMSAALGYHHGCWSGFKNLNDTPLVDKTLSFFYSSLIPSTTTALAMMVNYDLFGDKTESWHPPKTERDGFWEPGSESSAYVGGVPRGLKPDVTVCKGGACNFGTVQEAVNAAPNEAAGLGSRFVIWIKAGVYEETVRVPLEKKKVVFLGDGMGKTVITGSLNVGQMGMSTYNSATLGVFGDGFMASGLTIQNTAGSDAHQAVAFVSDSDLSVVENCEFLGNQDTLYAHSLRQYYKSCRIQGNIDFIFGNSAAFFQDCLILIGPRELTSGKGKGEGEGESNAVTAQGRMDPSQSTGFVFQNCVINGTNAYMDLYHSNPAVHKNYLGRPWRDYSRTVFIRCTMEALIHPDGWTPWSGDFALKSLYYGEFENRGAGSDVSKRVGWSSQIGGEHVYAYSVQNFIQGQHWIPAASPPPDA
ncbi:probable pectinesterase/pectinesterase inhibitor 51 [Andrographis paniculata]|uniref:probable pectinesterase/pectinesterase inhibitor 51 n=1 Tax=Andrographis paniculata TaxID=175694 RepID=UPI0021E99594|nr:probable pectinesterase/pectinesterase inhibitor 51 [Andrographis paniculata]